MCLVPDKPLLERDPLRFDSCKRPSPVNDHSIFPFWLVAYGRFDCIQLLNKPGRNNHHQRRNGYSLQQVKVEPLEYGNVGGSGRAYCFSRQLWIVSSRETFLNKDETSGALNDCFLHNICLEKQKLRIIFYRLGKAKNFYMTVPFMYSFGNLVPRALFPPPKPGKIENFRSIFNQIPVRFSKVQFVGIQSPGQAIFFVEKGNLTFSDLKCVRNRDQKNCHFRKT